MNAIDTTRFQSPLVTTIIPTFRRPRLLQRAVESALGQSYGLCEILVLDNASGDETGNIIGQLAVQTKRIKYLCREKNIGFVNSLIDGVSRVQTPYFSVLSDDDVLAPEFYQVAMEGFRKYPDAAMSSLNAIRVAIDGAILYSPGEHGGEVHRYLLPEETLRAIKAGSVVIPWIGTVFATEMMRKLGPPNPLAGPCINDNMILRAAARYPCVISQKIGVAITENYASLGYSMPALSKENVGWWMSTVNDIERDSLVDKSISRIAKSLIMPNLRYLVLQQIVHGIAEIGGKNLAYANNAAVGIGQCGYRYYSLLLRMLLWIYGRSAIIRSLTLLVLAKIGLRSLKQKKEQTAPEFASFVKPVSES